LKKSAVIDLAGEAVLRHGRLAHREPDSDSESAELGVSETSAWFLWQELEKGWSLSVRRFLLNLDGKSWPRTDFDLGTVRRWPMVPSRRLFLHRT
jgi:hypothetical protein